MSSSFRHMSYYPLQEASRIVTVSFVAKSFEQPTITGTLTKWGAEVEFKREK
jgi:polyisoprenoid-binding protein YceI